MFFLNIHLFHFHLTLAAVWLSQDVAGAPSMEAVKRAEGEHPSGTGLFAGVARRSFLYEGGHALLSVSCGDHLS